MSTEFYPMTNELLKKWLIDKEHGVYKIVLERYGSELSTMGPKLFIKWLATELDMDEKDINYNSLNQLKWQTKKRLKKENTKPVAIHPTISATEKKSGSKLAVFKNFDPGPESKDNSAIDMDELAKSGFLKKK